MIKAITFDLWDTVIHDGSDVQRRAKQGMRSKKAERRHLVWEALDAGDFSSLRERGIAATRQLAKRQVTWLRSMPQRRVIACDGPQPVPELLAGLQRLLG